MRHCVGSVIEATTWRFRGYPATLRPPTATRSVYDPDLTRAPAKRRSAAEAPDGANATSAGPTASTFVGEGGGVAERVARLDGHRRLAARRADERPAGAFLEVRQRHRAPDGIRPRSLQTNLERRAGKRITLHAAPPLTLRLDGEDGKFVLANLVRSESRDCDVPLRRNLRLHGAGTFPDRHDDERGSIRAVRHRRFSFLRARRTHGVPVRIAAHHANLERRSRAPSRLRIRRDHLARFRIELVGRALDDDDARLTRGAQLQLVVSGAHEAVPNVVRPVPEIFHRRRRRRRVRESTACRAESRRG